MSKVTFNQTLNQSINGVGMTVFRIMKQMYANHGKQAQKVDDPVVEETRTMVLNPFQAKPIQFDFKVEMRQRSNEGVVFNFDGLDFDYIPVAVKLNLKGKFDLILDLNVHRPSLYRFNPSDKGSGDAIRLFHYKCDRKTGFTVNTYDVSITEHENSIFDNLRFELNQVNTDASKLLKEAKQINPVFGSNISLHDDYTRLYLKFEVCGSDDIFISLTDYIKLLICERYLKGHVANIFKTDEELVKDNLPLPELRVFHREDKLANHKREVASYIKSRFMKVNKRIEVNINKDATNKTLDEKAEVLHNLFAAGLYSTRADRQRIRGAELVIDSNILNDTTFVYDASKDIVYFDAYESDVIGNIIDTNHNVPEFRNFTFRPTELVALSIKDSKGEGATVDTPRLIISLKSNDGSYTSDGFNSNSRFSDSYHYYQTQSVQVEEVGFNQLHSLYLKQVRDNGDIVYMHLAEKFKLGIKAHNDNDQKYEFFVTYHDKAVKEKKKETNHPLIQEMQMEFTGEVHCRPEDIRPFVEAIMRRKEKETEELKKQVEAFRTHLAYLTSKVLDEPDVCNATQSIINNFKGLRTFEDSQDMDNENTLKIRRSIFNHDVYVEIISSPRDNGRHYDFKADTYKGRFSVSEGWNTAVLLPFLINGNVVKFTPSVIGYSYSNFNHQFVSLYENNEELVGHSFVYDRSMGTEVNHIQTIGYRINSNDDLLLTNDPFLTNNPNVLNECKEMLYVKGDISNMDWIDGEIKEKKALIRLDVFLLLLKLSMAIE